MWALISDPGITVLPPRIMLTDLGFILEMFVTGVQMLLLTCIYHWLGTTLIMLNSFCALITESIHIPTNQFKEE